MREGDSYRPGQLLRAGRIAPYTEQEHGEWKFLMWDEHTGRPRMPMGSSGFRWGQTKGKWNLKLEDGLDGSPIDPALSFLDQSDEVLTVSFDDFAEGGTLLRGVPVRWVATADGERVPVATIYDILMAQYGVPRGLPEPTRRATTRTRPTPRRGPSASPE